MESENFCVKKFLEEYNLFLNQLSYLFDEESDKNLIKKLVDECDTDKISRGKLFYESLEEENLYMLFCKSKVRLFSSKDDNTDVVSNSLLGEKLPLKKLLNNQDDTTKIVIWKYLHLFYFLFESMNKNRADRMSKISKILKNVTSNLTEEVKNDFLNVDVNKDTNNMIEDIVKSFEQSLSSGSGNPFESIMDITQNITEKYTQKIESGDIELDKLMGSIQENIPGMPNLAGLGKDKTPKEKVVIDEEFSTDNVELGDKDKEEKSPNLDLNSMMKMMNSLNKDGDGNNPDFGGLFSMLGKLDKIDSTEDAENLKKEMDTYLESELGVDISKLNQQIEKNSDTIKINEEDLIEEPDQD